LPASSLDLLKGTLDLLILKTLSWAPSHGYGVARWIEQVTDDVLRVEEGSLYPALHRLEKQGWVESDWGLSENNRRAKYYTITADGKKHLRAESADWSRFSAAVFKVLDTAPRPA
jgi:transcriptional regulator